MIPLFIFSSIKLIFVVALLGASALFMLAGFKNWRWFQNMLFGKEFTAKMNGNMGPVAAAGIGIVLAMIALWLIF